MVEYGLLLRLGDVLRKVLPDRKRYFVITVPPVRKRWGKAAVRALERHYETTAKQVVAVLSRLPGPVLKQV